MRTQAARRDSRYATRLDVRLNAALREVGSSQRFTVDVIDLSLTGFRCETSFTLREGQAVSVTIPGLAPLEATVAWADGFRYGCAFERALHVAVYDHFVARYRKA